MKSVALTGTRGHVPGVVFMDTSEAMRRVGNNCGNLVFQFAVDRMIGDPTKVVGEDIPWAPEKIKEECCVVAVPSANFLREGFDFSPFVSFLERTELPLMFLGLGAQADTFEQTSFTFHSSILRLIDLIKERSCQVSVRGEFTARVLAEYGVTNVVVTGCPSNFINLSPKLPDVIASKLQQPLESFIAHADEPWPQNQIKRDIERRLVDWTRNAHGVMVQQSVPAEIEYLRRNNFLAGDLDYNEFEGKLAQALMPDCHISSFREFVLTKLRNYFSVDQWMEDSAKFDFSVGLRLHGNMVAWQAGTPALWVNHDSRTRELAETMALPTISARKFVEECLSPHDARDRIDFDKSAYEKRRAVLGKAFLSVLRKHAVSASQEFLSWQSRN